MNVVRILYLINDVNFWLKLKVEDPTLQFSFYILRRLKSLTLLILVSTSRPLFVQKDTDL